MNSKSPSAQVKDIEGQVNLILRRLDMDQVPEKGRRALNELKQSLGFAKTYTQDYELSEMRQEQLDNAKKAKKKLNNARTQVLRASEFDVFGAIDVAQLSAEIETVIVDLK
ncbi:hypothetical protein KW803_03830 [Candidatus Saccharibacteria bacterium]|nr:hypothetical protein [Candidatus Saccharibacteria bacterium]